MPLPATNNVASISTGYTARVTDTAIICDCNAAGFQVTLPAASIVPGKQFSILKVDATVNVLVLATASGNINGAASQNTNTQYTGWTVISDGTNYFILV